MKDEIKEILEDYKKLGGEITKKLDNTAEYENWLIIQDYFDKLLDYITNLQEENEKLKSYIKLTDEEAKEYMYDVNKEIDRLNKECDTYMKIATKRGNIINELEKCVKEEYEYCYKRKAPAFGTGMGVARRILDKLKELKGDK